MTMSAPRRYRLIDAALQPHPHLDDEFASLPEALEAAIHWSRLLAFDPIQASIGVEVSTPCGSWRTLQNPTNAAAVTRYRSGRISESVA
jgi:hypothetical protein